MAVVAHPSGSFAATPYSRIKWGAIIAGTFVALAVWILLYALGVAIGLTAIDPTNPTSPSTAGIATGIWTLIMPLVALFVGAWVAARSAGTIDRVVGAIQGAVLWGVATVLGVILVGMVISWIVSGAVSAVGTTASAAGGIVTAPAGGGGTQDGVMQDIQQTLGLTTQDLLAPINQQLAEQGKPQITAEQLQQATRDVIDRALREGRLDRELLVTEIAQNTALSEADARDLATQIEARFQERRDQLMAQVQDVQQGALQAAEATGAAFWWIFFALLLGLGASIGGAALGVTRRQRVEAEVPPNAPPPAV